jgi:hypothetical protein
VLHAAWDLMKNNGGAAGYDKTTFDDIERSAHQAIDEIRKTVHQGKHQIYDADLQSYFDTIPHDRLIKAIKMRIVDQRVMFSPICVFGEKLYTRFNFLFQRPLQNSPLQKNR